MKCECGLNIYDTIIKIEGKYYKICSHCHNGNECSEKEYLQWSKTQNIGKAILAIFAIGVIIRCLYIYFKGV